MGLLLLLFFLDKDTRFNRDSGPIFNSFLYVLILLLAIPVLLIAAINLILHLAKVPVSPEARIAISAAVYILIGILLLAMIPTSFNLGSADLLELALVLSFYPLILFKNYLFGGV